MHFTLLQVIFGSLIIFFAFFTRALFGFGGGLISIKLLVFVFNLNFSVQLEDIFEVGLSGLLIKGEIQKINKKVLIPLILGSIIGTLSGTYLLKSFANDILQRLLGIVIILFSLNLLRKENQDEHVLPAPVGVLTGIIGGTLGGMYGASGPPFVIYLANQIKKKDILRATLIGLFAVDFSWRLAVFAVTGLITKDVLLMALYLTPALVVGTILGKKSFFTIDEARYRKLVVILLVITGLLLVMK